MQIVIDIPKDEYNIAKYGQYGNINVDVVRKAIANGTPLPKGHGRVIIEPTKEEIKKTVGGISDFADYGRGCVKAVLDNAETIIPADTESED